jgi:hypothetical protein
MSLGQLSSFPKFSATDNWEYGWRNENKYLMPKYFEGPMTSDFLQDRVCMCKGKSICSKNCVCFEQNLSCTDGGSLTREESFDKANFTPSLFRSLWTDLALPFGSYRSDRFRLSVFKTWKLCLRWTKFIVYELLRLSRKWRMSHQLSVAENLGNDEDCPSDI